MWYIKGNMTKFVQGINDKEKFYSGSNFQLNFSL